MQIRLELVKSFWYGDIYKKILNQLCGIKSVHDYFGMVEQTGSIYMECETGHLHQPKFTGKSPDSDFEIAVINAMEERGYECVPQLGVAHYFLDIAVKDPKKPGRFLMGFECYGAT